MKIEPLFYRSQPSKRDFWEWDLKIYETLLKNHSVNL